MSSFLVLYMTTLVLAQAPERVRFAFTADDLEIELAVRVPLTVEVEDGAPGEVTVESRAGASSYALDGNRLSIQHAGDDPVGYHIRVPPSARVRLTLRGRAIATLGRAEGQRRLVWSSGDDRRAAAWRAEPAGTRPAPTASEFRVQAFAGPLVVDSVNIALPQHARVLRVRLGRREFRVSGDRAVKFEYHAPTRWGVLTIREAGARVDLELPSGAERFLLKLDGQVLWRLNTAGARALCQPVARVRRKGGGDDWVFHLETEPVCREEGGVRPA